MRVQSPVTLPLVLQRPATRGRWQTSGDPSPPSWSHFAGSLHESPTLPDLRRHCVQSLPLFAARASTVCMQGICILVALLVPASVETYGLIIRYIRTLSDIALARALAVTQRPLGT
jgi:hypothetical protein